MELGVGVGCGGSPREPQRLCAACFLPWMGVGEGQPSRLLPPASLGLRFLCSEAVGKVGETLL